MLTGFAFQLAPASLALSVFQRSPLPAKCSYTCLHCLSTSVEGLHRASIGFLLRRISQLFLDTSWFTVLLHSSYRQTLARSFSLIPRYRFIPYEPNSFRFVQFDDPSRPMLSSSSNRFFATIVKKAISRRVSVARITSEILFSDQRDLRKNTLECKINSSRDSI